MKHKPIFVSGIGTGIGKTVTSAVLVESLQADYWKPVQSGDLDLTDTDRVRALVSNGKSLFHAEAYRLTQPFSPHKSAALDNISISMDAIVLPQTDNRLIIEGAGGLMVPLNETDLMVDLIQKLDAEVVLVSQNYLGSINHTLLSLELLKSRNISLRALVICGEENKDSENIIRIKSGIEILHIPFFEPLNKQVISSFSKEFVL
ncbi:dethiobiotin synthase [Daejeonella sp. JGW-45]|uniref:dethiobiotin synthase n=1 Tax=Daejeonella sp. JGW-45 TaxID=3034148 RepID=UPI0023ED0520|nr:dethiobiotin synthase [Daejeonella sp. JGW-45]